MSDLRSQALAVLLERNPDQKATAARSVDIACLVHCDITFAEPDPKATPGRQERPALVPHIQLKKRSVKTLEGKAALLHSIAHIELNAIDLAADIVWRFPHMPELFYRQWAKIMQEEALHFQLLRDHLQSMGYQYGDFDAHDGLWQMAEKTKSDLLARLALVPRTLEARGLDASPPLKNKLISVGDLKAGEILDVILRDEIGHVAVGNHWYRWMCEARGLDPVSTYAELAAMYGAPKQRGPMNEAARLKAGFTPDELARLKQ